MTKVNPSNPASRGFPSTTQENKRECYLMRCLTRIYNLFASLFCCFRSEKRVAKPLDPEKVKLVVPASAIKDFSTQFITDFYTDGQGLLFSKDALERFKKAHPREQDQLLHTLTEKNCFSALFQYINHLLKKDRRETLYAIAQASKCGGKESFVNPNKVTGTQTKWMKKIFEKGIPSSSVYCQNKDQWLV